MDTKLLSAYIEQYHHSDPEAMEKIICKMSPLLRKYANKFPYCDREDAYQEFSITLIECTQNIPDYSVEAKCLAYFKKAILNKYICLKDQKPDEDLLGDDPELRLPVSHLLSEDTTAVTELAIFLRTFSQKLSPRKQAIFKGLLGRLSCMEIARELHISRQYVHKARQSIQKELKKQLIPETNCRNKPPVRQKKDSQ